METQSAPPHDQADVRLIAFYLPQYHPIPENDRWWGRGFTEWTNVAKARPLYPGHYQPHLPADLGFYDLRVPEVRQQQADLARAYGIHGFCYYHYWFGGKRLLERPFHEVLASGEPDLPFCLCWANEPWSRRWDGSENEILMPQSYSVEDDREHLRWLARAFSDRRYIRVDGKPLFLVYRVSGLPAPARTADTWREEARRLGIGELFLCRVEQFAPDRASDPRTSGFDASVEFAPSLDDQGPRLKFDGRRWRWGRRLGLVSEAYARHDIRDYATLAALGMARTLPRYEMFRCVTPGWDNTARRASYGAWILDGPTPECYQNWLSFVIRQAEAQPPDHRIVFINAWNEWAEGNHLEPCRKWGRAYLEATRRALRGNGVAGPSARVDPVPAGNAWLF
jgi:lipopolysaccharide biosynthesis protein